MMIRYNLKLLINSVYMKICIGFVYIISVISTYKLCLEGIYIDYEQFVSLVEQPMYIYFFIFPLFLINIIRISEMYYREYVFVRFSKNLAWIREKNIIAIIYTTILVVGQKLFNLFEYCYSQKVLIELEEGINFLCQLVSAILILYSLWLIVDMFYGIVQNSNAVYLTYIVVSVLQIGFFREYNFAKLYVLDKGYVGCAVVVGVVLGVSAISKIYWKRKSILIKKKG